MSTTTTLIPRPDWAHSTEVYDPHATGDLASETHQIVIGRAGQVEVRLEQFASLDVDGLEVEGPFVRVDTPRSDTHVTDPAELDRLALLLFRAARDLRAARR